jgi:nucleosome assembly protein 1-like 1
MDEEEKEIEQKMIKVISQMPEKVQARFKVLKVLSDRRSKLSDDFDREIKALEAKIAQRKAPLYEQRRQIVAGEVTDFAAAKAKFEETHAKLEAHKIEVIDKKKKEGDKPEEELKKVEVDNLKGVQGIPDFWFRSIKNNQMIFELVKEKDEAILTHLRHVETERSEPTPGDSASRKSLTVRFLFAENEFFSEKTLSMKVVYKPDTEDEVERIEGTPISWADETKDPTKKKIKKKQKHKKTNETRTIVKTVEAESFFNVFTSRVAPEEGAGDMDEEEENELRDKIDAAMNLAEDVDDVLIPDALEYYLGLADDLYGGEGLEDEEDEDSDDAGDKDTEGDSKKGDKKAEA